MRNLSFRKPFKENLKASSLYLYFLICTNIGLLIPQTRLLASLLLICLLPGYCFSERFLIWKNPFFAAVGSISLSFLFASLIPLPACIIFQKINAGILIGSTNIFIVLILFFSKKRRPSTHMEDDHTPIFLTVLLICLWVYIYMDVTKLGPFDFDWIYLGGIVKECSLNFPPRNPGASFLPLKQPWGFWFIFGIIHKLSEVSTWDVLAIMSVVCSFIFLGLVYMVLFEITGESVAGLGAILFLAIGKYSEWIYYSVKAGSWTPAYNNNTMIWQHVQAVTGYNLLWGWYTLPGLILILTSFYFLIGYLKEKNPLNLFLSLGICSIGPFFHPAYYLAFMIGLSCFFLGQWIIKKPNPWFFLYFLTFIPYYLTFYLYFRPSVPDDPLYLFQLDKSSISSHFWAYLGSHGVAIPLAILAVILSQKSRTWILPFVVPFALLSLLGRWELNQVHLWLVDSFYISLLAGIGLACLAQKISRKKLTLVLIVIVLVIAPPFIHEVSYRIKEGWEGIISSEQKVAGDFIRRMTPLKSNFVILPNSRYSAETVMSMGERVVTMGFPDQLTKMHKFIWIIKWTEEIKNFFLTPDADKRKAFLKKYKVDYIFLGPDEIGWMKENHSDIELFIKPYEALYKIPEIQILKVDRHE